MADEQPSIDTPREPELSDTSGIIDFPRAIPADEWYEYPPIEAGAPKPFDQTRLGQLPVDLRLEILEFLQEGRTDWDVTEYRPRRHAAPRVNVDYVRVFQGPLGTCRELRKEVLSIVTTTTSFYCRKPKSVLSLCGHLSEIQMSTIRFLKLETSFVLLHYVLWQHLLIMHLTRKISMIVNISPVADSPAVAPQQPFETTEHVGDHVGSMRALVKLKGG